jgi:hypothetical protein
MIDVSLFEPANPLIPADQLPSETAFKPGWNIRKLSMARLDSSVFSKVLRESNQLPVIQEDKESPQKSDLIPICYGGTIMDPSFTTNIIYERYRPNNLKEMKDYLYFIANYRKISPNFPQPHQYSQEK